MEAQDLYKGMRTPRETIAGSPHKCERCEKPMRIGQRMVMAWRPDGTLDLLHPFCARMWKLEWPEWRPTLPWQQLAKTQWVTCGVTHGFEILKDRKEEQYMLVRGEVLTVGIYPTLLLAQYHAELEMQNKFYEKNVAILNANEENTETENTETFSGVENETFSEELFPAKEPTMGKLFQGAAATATAAPKTVVKKPVAAAKPAAKPAAKAAPAAAKAPGKPAAEKAPKEPKQPKAPGTAMSAEEYADAVACRLKPRENKGDKKQEALTAMGESGRPKGRPLGLTTGLPILGAWCYVFQENEKAKQADRLTDEEITNWLKKEFPGRETPAFDHPNRARREYNEGKFTRGTPPVRQSRSYDKDGNVLAEKKRGDQEASRVTKPAAATTPAKPKKKVFAVGD